MINLFLDILTYLKTATPLLFGIAFYALFFILLAKSIKKYYYIYYTIFAIPFFMVVIPTILGWCGIDLGIDFFKIPVLGGFLRDYFHMANLGHPVLVVIMYIGALDARNPNVKRLMSIRKEMSILVGFPVLTHAWIRIINNFPNALKYFTNHEEFMQNPRVTSALGAGISNTVLVLGIVMTALFLVLWITSFDKVRKKMGGIAWKKLQKWAYVLYALLFIHAMGLQAGRMISSAAAEKKAATEITAQSSPNATQESTPTESRGVQGRQSGDNTQAKRSSGESTEGRNGKRQQPSSEQQGQSRQTSGRQQEQQQGGQQQSQGGGRRQAAKGLTEYLPSNDVRSWLTVVSLLLVYGSYLVLKVRKERNKRARKG